MAQFLSSPSRHIIGFANYFLGQIATPHTPSRVLRTVLALWLTGGYPLEEVVPWVLDALLVEYLQYL